MTQKEIAKKLGCSQQFISAVLHGRKRPSPRMAARLERITGVPLRVWLLGTPKQRQRGWEKFQRQYQRKMAAKQRRRAS